MLKQSYIMIVANFDYNIFKLTQVIKKNIKGSLDWGSLVV